MRSRPILAPLVLSLMAGGLSMPVLADDAAVLRQLQEQMQQMQAQIEALNNKLAEQSESQKKVADTVTKNEKEDKARRVAAEVYGILSLSADFNSDDFGDGDKGWGLKDNVSRFGFRGDIPTTLGGNTRVFYNAEVQYGAANEPAVSSANQFQMMQGFVGLKGNWGSTRLGRLTVPYKAVYAAIDPWVDRVAQARQGGRQGASALNANYFNNTVEYISPGLSGFKFSGWLSHQFDNEDTATSGFLHNAAPLNQFKGGKSYGLGARYEKGSWLASLDWIEFDADAITAQAATIKNLSNESGVKLTGRYKAKDWSVAAHYEDTEDIGLGKNYYLNGIYNLDKLRLVATLGRNENARTYMTGTTNLNALYNNADTWSFGGLYQIAKSTDLFMVYNSRTQDRNISATVGDDLDTLSIGLITNFSSK